MYISSIKPENPFRILVIKTTKNSLNDITLVSSSPIQSIYLIIAEHSTNDTEFDTIDLIGTGIDKNYDFWNCNNDTNRPMIKFNNNSKYLRIILM